MVASDKSACYFVAPGCPTYLNKDNFRCDASLNMEIQELRIREQATQMAGYHELDVDDETV